MNDCSNLTTLLFGTGFALVVISIVAMCIRVALDKKMYNGGMKFVTAIVILLFLSGGVSLLYKDKIPEDIQNLKIGGNVTAVSGAIASSSENSGISQTNGNSSNENTTSSSTYAVQSNAGQSSSQITANDLIGGWNATDEDGSPTNKNAFMILYIPDSSQLYLRNEFTNNNFDYKTQKAVDYYEHYDYQINTSGIGDFDITISLIDDGAFNGSGGEREFKFIDKNTIDYITFDGHYYTLKRIDNSQAKSMLGLDN